MRMVRRRRAALCLRGVRHLTFTQIRWHPFVYRAHSLPFGPRGLVPCLAVNPVTPWEGFT